MTTRSKVKEMADAEAARAEAESPEDDEQEAEDEQGEDETGAELEDETGAELEDEQQELSAEAFAAGMESELKRHSEALARLFGPGYAEFVECPTCQLLGVIDPTIFPVDNTVTRCERCQGRGELLTGATNPNNITRQCPDCFGNGWRDKPAPLPPPMPVQTAPGVWEPPPATTPTPAPNGPVPQIPPMPQYDPVRNVWFDPATGQVLSGATGSASPEAVTP